MSINEFLDELQDLLQRDTPLAVDDVLEGMEEWDSMAIMSCQVWFETRLEIRHPYKFFQAQKTVQDLINASEGKIA